MTSHPNLAAAEEFIWRTARLIDRYRYDFLFRGGSSDKVVEALSPYQNGDGGFGNALEPDLRTPSSQPVPVWSAFQVLDEIDHFRDSMVTRACDYLVTITQPDGGVPFVLPSAGAYPHAPWWETTDDSQGALVPTAGIAALLYKHKVDHPWRTAASEFCWRHIDALDATNPYDARFVLHFLEQVPDRARAQQAFARIGPKILEQGLVTLDPGASGEVHTPLDFAPRPDSLARQLFSDEVIETHLDALVRAQKADGGWMFNWEDWNPATTQEWRGWLTIENLKTLRAYDRL